MIDEHARTERPGVALFEVSPDGISAYGCVSIESSSKVDDRLTVVGCVEKPHPSLAPSAFAIAGRYVLGSQVIDALKHVPPDEGGEIQLTPALNVAAIRCHLDGLLIRAEDRRYDVGNWTGWCAANAAATFGAGAMGRSWLALEMQCPEHLGSEFCTLSNRIRASSSGRPRVLSG
jgi:UTP--glucose-1-phosphate uridylyltransferase